MVDIERAPLPPPSKRGRKPKAPVYSTDRELDEALQKDAAYIEAMGGNSGPTLADMGWTTQLDARPRSKCCGRDLVYEGCFCAVPDDGWTGAQEVKRYPTEGYSYMVGGAFNGQERDMRSHGNAKFVALPLDNGDVEWYERGEVSGYVWIASVTPQGIELRETAL